ncbi:MAG TPA: Gfo/Idh/MocA family oxidoreductase [Candidatus Eisenbacteria bacterium]
MAAPVLVTRDGLRPAADCPRPLRPVRVALAGLGRAGLAHATLLGSIPDCELAAVVDPRREARTRLRGLGYDARAFPSLRKMLAAIQPDAVFVCGPQHERAAAAAAALEAGAAVFVEHPLGVTLEQAEAVAAKAAATGRPLASACALAFTPVFVRARELLAAGVLGEVRQARSSMFVSRVFDAGHPVHHEPGPVAGGVLAQVASELLFLLLWYLGPPVMARATSSRIYGGIEDELHAMMTLARGAEVGLDCSWSVPGYPEAAAVIELEGEHGKLLVSDDGIEADLGAPRAGLAAGHTRIRSAELPQVAAFDWGGDAMYLMDASFLAWATGGPAVPNDGAAALAVHRVMDALYRSARAGGEPESLAP